ncbi:MAG: WD40 repeat domain-containing protein [Arachnia sp.]
MTDGTAVAAGTQWDARVEGEITAVAVRAGEPAALAVATEDGTCWWIDDAGVIRAHTPTEVDLPTSIAVHPLHDEITVTGPQGYAIWQPGHAPRHFRAGWSSSSSYSRNGDLAVAAGRTVILHSPHAEEYTSTPAPSTVTGLAWSRQANRVAASAYGGVYVYDNQHPAPVRTHPYTGSHLAVALSPTGGWVCSGNQDASVHIWRSADNSELQMRGFPSKVTRLAFDSTGRWLANNGAADVAVWDFAGKGPEGRGAQMLKGHTMVADLDWRPGASTTLASVGSEGEVRVWTLRPGGRGLPQSWAFGLDDARMVRWMDPGRLIVTRAHGVVTALPWRKP